MTSPRTLVRNPGRTTRALIALSSFAAISAGASAQTIVHYDPVGSQASNTPVPATTVGSGVIATDLSQTGFGAWINTDVWPVGKLGAASATLDPNQYLEFEVTLAGPTQFTNLTYTKRSYSGDGCREAAVRTSLDNFSSNAAVVTGINPGGTEQLDFDLTSVAPASGAVRFRVYFYDAPFAGDDWVDLISTVQMGTGLLLEGVAGGIGTPYCGPAVPNSTGAAGTLTASGSPSVAANNLTLTASDLPQNQFGIFVVSDTQAFVMGAGGTSNGNLCVGGGIGRYSNPGEIQATGTSGEFSFMIDVNAIRRPTNNVPAMPGDTWYFQAWHRDGVGQGSNFTNGMQVDFF